jgi:pimeloyl-ACP methyl ester carboxylesterase
MQEFRFFPTELLSAHIIIPTSVNHEYKTNAKGAFYRNALYIKKYHSPQPDPTANPVIFFHGGPEFINQEEYKEMTVYFTQRGHSFYIPEIEGSGMYSRPEYPIGFDPATIPEELKLFGLHGTGCNGLNEFIMNYADDVRDVIDFVSKQHPGKKVNIITHSAGGHQLLRTLQQTPNQRDKIDLICIVAGTSDMGANRFWTKRAILASSKNEEWFYQELQTGCSYHLLSEANQNQSSFEITKKNNPAINQQMNQFISVHYGDLSKMPPMLIVHAKDDKSVFFQNSVVLYKKVRQQAGTAHGLFLEKGGHAVIKSDGDSETRDLVLSKIHHFFTNPLMEMQDDLGQIQYEDVLSDHDLFIKDKVEYIQKKINEPSAYII